MTPLALSALSVGTALAASWWWYFAVPRVTIRDLPGEDPPPDFAALVTWRSTVAVGVVALLASAILVILPPWAGWIWCPYLALSTPLIAVDARTTWLPLCLHRWALVGVVAGVLVIALEYQQAALGALLGGIGARALFWVAWRIGTGLGFGDVRFAAIVGAVAGTSGLEAWLSALVGVAAVGAGYAVVHLIRRRSQPDIPGYFPYGPALWCGPLIGAALS